MTSKLGTLAVALVCGVLTTRLIVGTAGPGAFALYTLLTAIPAMFIFLDLGSGAAVVNGVATSTDTRHDEELVTTVTTVWRIILAFALALALGDILVLVTGTWPRILGEAGRQPGAALAATACVLVFCGSVALAIWQRLLLGLGKNHLIVLLQGLQAPLNLLVVWLLVSRPAGPLTAYLALGSFIAALVVAGCGVFVAHRLTAPLLSTVRRRLPEVRRHPGTRVMDVGWPMLAQVLASPLAIGLQRYLLAQDGSEHDVAEYGVLGQVFFAVLGVIAAAGLALWPAFAQARASGRLRRGPFLLAAGFAGGTATATMLVWAVRGPLFAFITHGAIDVAGSHVLLFGAMVTTQAALYPLGMFIMDREGLRFQVMPVVLMVASTIALTLLLTPSLGVSGPLVASTVSTVLFQIIPFSAYIRRHRDRLWGGGGALSRPPATAAIR
ncbi:MAG: hypothetical protein ABIW80_05040 [Lapillicoccus sp.]